MEQQSGKSSPQQQPVKSAAAQDMDREIIAHAIETLGAENGKLDDDLALIDDAITSKGIDNWMSVGSVINVLTDKTEIDKLIESVPPTSKFHKDSLGYVAVKNLVSCLEYWRTEQLVSNQDSVVKVFNILTERRQENLSLLE